MNSQKSAVKLIHVVGIFMAIIATFAAMLLYVMPPKTFAVSYQEIANMAGEIAPMNTTPGTSDADCWIEGFYLEGFIGVCKKLDESLVTFALYSYEGLPITQFFVVEQVESKLVAGQRLSSGPRNFGFKRLNENFIQENIPGLTEAQSPERISSGRMSFLNGDRQMWQIGYLLGDGKELWVTNYSSCSSCKTFVLVNDHNYVVLGHHDHNLISSHESERAIIGQNTFFVSGNDLLVYQEGSSVIQIREVDFSAQLRFTNSQEQTCHFEFVGFTNVMYHPSGVDESLVSQLGLPEDYLVKARVIVVRLSQGKGTNFVIFGTDIVSAGSIWGQGEYEFQITIPPTPLREFPELVGHSVNYRVFNSEAGSVLMLEAVYSPRAYQYFDSEEICNPSLFQPETVLRRTPLPAFGS